MTKPKDSHLIQEVPVVCRLLRIGGGKRMSKSCRHFHWGGGFIKAARQAGTTSSMIAQARVSGSTRHLLLLLLLLLIRACRISIGAG
jgi:hypothetical protein